MSNPTPPVTPSRASAVEQRQREAVNVAIAKACGWTDVYVARLLVWRDQVVGRPPGMPHHRQPVPNYAESIDAMHEAEKTLDANQRGKYAQLLLEPQWMQSSRWDCAHANAEKRAKAFLMVLNLWPPATA